MPTGLTAGVGDGEVTTLEQFAWRCARQFGALVDLRDSPDAPIPQELKPRLYHAEALAKAEARYLEVVGWSDEEAEDAANDFYLAEVEANKRINREKAEKRARYEAMLEKVRAWEPPTPEHLGLRELMEEQLVQSIEWDCKPYELRFEIMTGAQYRQAEIARAEHDIQYHARELEAERERVAGRNAWIKALRESLGEAPVGT